jgi:hypothetical protein
MKGIINYFFQLEYWSHVDDDMKKPLLRSIKTAPYIALLSHCTLVSICALCLEKVKISLPKVKTLPSKEIKA